MVSTFLSQGRKFPPNDLPSVPRSWPSRSFISWSVRVKSKTSKFCWILDFLVLLGMTIMPFWIWCLSSTWAGVLPCALEILTTTGSSNTLWMVLLEASLPKKDKWLNLTCWCQCHSRGNTGWSQWSVGHQFDAHLGQVLPQPPLLEVEPAFNLVHSDGYPALLHDVGNLGAAEVGDANTPAKGCNSTDFFIFRKYSQSSFTITSLTIRHLT